MARAAAGATGEAARKLRGFARDLLAPVLASSDFTSGRLAVVVTADDVVHGKPAPDMFLLAAKRMGVAPEKCLVFEDAEPGMRAAEAAGMKWVRVPSRAPKAPKK